MNRLYLALVAAATLGGCGSNKTFGSICADDPPPAQCGVMCDPAAANSCGAGFHCTPDGTCDAQCTLGGTECGDGYACTADGFCESTSMGSNGPDSSCPAINFTPMPVTPSIELVLDRSGSMSGNDISPTRYGAMHTGLTGASGAITSAQALVYFGALLYSGDQCPLTMAGFSVARALNNASAIDALIAGHSPGGNTPTAEALTLVTQDFANNPPPANSPPIILLATDGEPNSCNSSTPTPGPSIAAAQAAYTAGIRTFIVGLAGLNNQFLQDMANAGTGVATGQAPGCSGCAPFYTANDPASLVAGFNAIINGVISCDLSLTSGIDATAAMSGTVILNGVTLTYGTDWTLVNGNIVRLLGQACTDLKNSVNPMVSASFPCGSVIF